ncbi:MULTISPECIES: bifunctional 3,4-dihydroxy-2-butanone-4-phosphate synthase/GTP cyclohydrolase II [unclassified Leifsonia]|uniref:bifunctional 3,4-dihydroxy-2-butanone-4-phosphate synthase/GTP cyclohydrolase II n=1 Tax=unclassified Leifsonia TaxID=2663824 RepID=UPI0006F57A55|nr:MULTISPECIES: bifunctional 3,4-dihydroxy-2-butanone-4-phosphate synthase/GTP cyclohydrolase II [unclassified Leifsonia]KQX06343.1 GTP cyclohydrolase [Leifsonia sp. Root1293]KRA10627.1 GTP cyclohydrolase [Leifsonia sp. Root60]
MSLATIPEVLDALRAGKPVIVADDEARENEGDAIMAAELASQEWIAWMVRNTSGFLCAPMPDEYADRLELPLMTTQSQDARGTAYTITVDASDRVSTGISAADRAHTLRVLADPTSQPENLIRPGHVLPLRAKEGGVRERGGHTEAAVDLMKLAGLSPVGVIGEIVADDGEMMRLPGLIELGAREDLPVTTVAAIIDYLQEWHCDTDVPVAVPIPESSRVDFEVETTVPTTHGPFKVRAYRDRHTGADHVAIVAGTPEASGALVRVHSECLTGEAFGSLKCECGPQLDAALDTIQRDGGIVIYLRGHEGRGIGLINKLRAYRLQEDGLDTLDANLALGLPADARDYGAATAILDQMGITSVRLLTNNPEKVRQLEERGVTVTERVPLVVGVGAFNESYLETKRDRMGHAIADQQLAESVRLTAAGTEPLLEGHAS